MLENELKRNLFMGQEIRGLNFGIIGYGRIGKILGKIAKSFEMNVLHYDIQNKKTKQIFINC